MTFHASIKNSIVSKMEISEGGKPWQIASIIFSTTLIQLLFLESLWQLGSDIKGEKLFLQLNRLSIL